MTCKARPKMYRYEVRNRETGEVVERVESINRIWAQNHAIILRDEHDKDGNHYETARVDVFTWTVNP